MADSISPVTVTTHGADEFKARWGTSVYDYSLNGVAVDFQDLMVAISEHRATAVEGEVGPLSTRMRTRNATLSELGDDLADLSKLQAQFKSDDSGSTRHGSLKSTTKASLLKIFGSLDWDRLDLTKYETEEWIQKVKSKIDSLNNEAQTDMTRLQSLVDRRDESFTTATTLMTNVSDTRDNAIRNR